MIRDILTPGCVVHVFLLHAIGVVKLDTCHAEIAKEFCVKGVVERIHVGVHISDEKIFKCGCKHKIK